MGADWKLILHGNETYPYSLSIHTADGSGWIVRDGTVSSIEAAQMMVAAPKTIALLRRFVALPSGAWHPERHAAEEAELMQEARDLLASLPYEPA